MSRSGKRARAVFDSDSECDVGKKEESVKKEETQKESTEEKVVSQQKEEVFVCEKVVPEEKTDNI